MPHPIAYRIPALVVAILLAGTWLTGSVSAHDEPTAGEETAEAEPETTETEKQLEVDWYGYIKVDAAWDDSIIDAGNFARWATSPSIVEEHSHFNVTARQTRIGVDLTRQSGDLPPITAKIEIDFYGGGAENKNRPQLRHAYFEVPWPERGWTLTAGQTSDVISPLAPSTLNYTVAWWVGNIGYRRPMIKGTKTFAGDNGDETRFAVAVSRTIGDDFGSLEPGDSGVDSGLPTVQTALSRSFTGAGGRPAKIGLSGHWGQEQLEETLGQPVPEFDSWSANLDFSLPLGKTATLKGEAWTGVNLDDYFGGIGQGIDFTRNLEVEAMGGWLAVDTRPAKGTTASFGVGIDDPDDETLPAGARARNQAVWANLVQGLRPDLKFGIEASWWETEYLGLEDGSSLRFQTSLIYGF